MCARDSASTRLSSSRLHGYLPVAKHPPIRQLPVSSDQKSEGSEGYGLGAWHPGLLGPTVWDCEGMAVPSCLLPILAQKSGVESAHF